MVLFEQFWVKTGGGPRGEPVKTTRCDLDAWQSAKLAVRAPGAIGQAGIGLDMDGNSRPGSDQPEDFPHAIAVTGLRQDGCRRNSARLWPRRILGGLSRAAGRGIPNACFKHNLASGSTIFSGGWLGLASAVGRAGCTGSPVSRRADSTLSPTSGRNCPPAR